MIDLRWCLRKRATSCPFHVLIPGKPLLYGPKARRLLTAECSAKTEYTLRHLLPGVPKQNKLQALIQNRICWSSITFTPIDPESWNGTSACFRTITVVRFSQNMHLLKKIRKKNKAQNQSGPGKNELGDVATTFGAKRILKTLYHSKSLFKKVDNIADSFPRTSWLRGIASFVLLCTIVYLPLTQFS